MTDNTDIVNLALQTFGAQTTITSAQLAASSNNESKQANLFLAKSRDQLLRMAPWNCAFNAALLNYISSVPGTPENDDTSVTQWVKGLPLPPWSYEYQYPVDCLRPVWIVPQFDTGFSGSVPISPVTVGMPSFWSGPPVPYKVGVDQFYGISAAAKVAGGSGYVVGDQITLSEGTDGDGGVPGASPILQVATLSGSAVATVTVVETVFGSSASGSLFKTPSGTFTQDSTTGVGSGATFTVTATAKGDQRVIFTNQEDAVLAYIKRVTDPNVMDELFLEAWTNYFGARLCIALTGDKTLANMCIQQANSKIIAARTSDGNEGYTVNDVTPDFLRTRGIAWPLMGSTPTTQFDWGGLLPAFF